MYTAAKALPSIKRVESVGKKEFTTVTLVPEDKAFIVYIIVYIVCLVNPNNVHPPCRAQIVFLMANKAPTTILLEYSDYADIFSPSLAAELSEYSKINVHVIDSIDGK